MVQPLPLRQVSNPPLFTISFFCLSFFFFLPQILLCICLYLNYTDQLDIVDETLTYFRANVLFRNFEVKGPADRVLIYLTLYVSQCLSRLEKVANKTDGARTLYNLAQEQFALPGDSGWPLGGIIPRTESRDEGGKKKKNFFTKT